MRALGGTLLLGLVTPAIACGAPEPRPAVAVSAPREAPPEPPKAALPPRPARLGVDFGFACAVRRDGSVWCWGKPRWSPDVLRSFRVPGIDDAVGVAIGGRNVCAVTRAGTVSCHGADITSSDDTVATRPIADLRDVVDLAATSGAHCFLHRGGAVECFVQPTRVTPTSFARASIPGLQGAVRLIAPCVGMHCAVLGDGRVAKFFAGGTRPAEVIPGLQDAVDFDGYGVPHDVWCAILRGGGIACTGDSPRLETGDALQLVSVMSDRRCALHRGGDVVCSSFGPSEPDQVRRPETRLRVGAVEARGYGGSFCALREDDAVVCWGDVDRGLLGTGVADVASTPVRIPLSGPARAITLDGSVTCAALATSVECWGRGNRARSIAGTAPGPEEPFHGPRKVADGTFDAMRLTRSRLLLAGPKPMVMERDYHTAWFPSTAPSATLPAAFAALDGAVSFDVVGWRSDTYFLAASREGLLTMVAERSRAKQPESSAPLAREVATVEGAFALRRDGQVVRIEDETGKTRPVDVGFAAQAIAGTHRSVCAVARGTGAVECVITGTKQSELTRPLAPAVSVALSPAVARPAICVVTRESGVRCVGEGSTADPLGPSPILQDLSSLRDVKRIALGESHACALSGDGAVHCWGSNRDDAIAAEPRTYSTTPIPVALGDL